MGIVKVRILFVVTAKIEEKGHITEGNTLFAFVGFVGGEEMNKWIWIDLRQETLTVNNLQ